MSSITISSESLPSGERLYRVAGPLTMYSLTRLESTVPYGTADSPVTLDLAGVTEFDSFGAVFLIRRAEASSGSFFVRRAPEDLKEFVAVLSRFPSPRVLEDTPPGPIEQLGRAAFAIKGGLRAFVVLGLEFFYWMGVAPFKGGRLYVHRVFGEVVAAGVAAIPIVLLISALMGVILALNAAAQLERFGATIFVANLVGVAMTKELGPVFTAILVAGRTGSAIAAELGTMKVTEEIDALQVMGINPRAFLVVPKIIALLAVMPCLVIMADIIGILGGLLISVGALNIPPGDYFTQTLASVQATDILTGLIKSGVFGFLIGLTGAVLGLRLRGGAEEVGRITTKSVVISFLLIIVSDTVFTVLFTRLGL